MLALGEDPEEFRRLHEELVRYWNPRDPFRRMLVEHLSNLLWQQARVHRAWTVWPSARSRGERTASAGDGLRHV